MRAVDRFPSRALRERRAPKISLPVADDPEQLKAGCGWMRPTSDPTQRSRSRPRAREFDRACPGDRRRRPFVVKGPIPVGRNRPLEDDWYRDTMGSPASSSGAASVPPLRRVRKAPPAVALPAGLRPRRGWRAYVFSTAPRLLADTCESRSYCHDDLSGSAAATGAVLLCDLPARNGPV